MATPIRITFRENAEHFIEAQNQSPPPLGKQISQKAQNLIIWVAAVGAFVFAFVQQYRKGTELKIIGISIVSVVLIIVFWLWFFRKIGLYKSTRASDYQWTQKDRTRLENAYLKKTGRPDMIVSYEFDDEGFTIIPEQSPPKKYLWPEIVRVIERPKGLFIYIRSWMYFWAPKAAFATAEDYRASVDIISRKVSRWESLDLAGMAYVALGSNLGEREEIVQSAIFALRELSGQPFLKSSLWQTSPVDCPPGSGGFINAMVAFTPVVGETPESLLLKLRGMEKKFGRAPKKVLNEPRPLDLDLIAFGNETRNTPDLVLPHPRAHLRKFVLEPLNEITPDFILAGQGRTVSQLLAGLSSGEAVVKIDSLKP